MYNRVGLARAHSGYVFEFTPSQFELVRRVIIDLYSGSHSSRVVTAVAGEDLAEILELRDREVDFNSRAGVEVLVDDAGIRALCGAVGFALLNLSSEEAFHNRYGFYSENVRTVGRAIFDALQRMDVSAD